MENAIRFLIQFFSDWKKDENAGEAFYKKAVLWIALFLTVAALIYFYSLGCSPTDLLKVGVFVFSFCCIAALTPLAIVNTLFNYFQVSIQYFGVVYSEIVEAPLSIPRVPYSVPLPPAIPKAAA